MSVNGERAADGRDRPCGQLRQPGGQGMPSAFAHPGNERLLEFCPTG